MKRRIRLSGTPQQAKTLGRSCQLRADWDEVKDKVMFEILQAKFRDRRLAKDLLDTRPHDLIEGNTWGDTYWGVCNGEGENKLGKLLMKVRNRLSNKYSSTAMKAKRIGRAMRERGH